MKPGDKDYEKLKRSIAEFGFVEPVVWNERTGFVVGGHQRLKVLLDMGVTPGARIIMRKVAPLGDPMEVTLRGYELTLRKAEADCVIMKEDDNA